MKIHYFIPTAFEGKNLGGACNYYCSLVPNDEDWICITDRDTFFIQPEYDQIINQAIRDNPKTGLFTCYTNRVGQHRQCWGERIDSNSDMIYARTVSNIIYKDNERKYKKLNIVISGYFMLFKKKTWNKIRFKNGLLGVDNDFSQKILDAGLDIILIEQLYVWHYYRLSEGITFKEHLK